MPTATRFRVLCAAACLALPGAATAGGASADAASLVQQQLTASSSLEQGRPGRVRCWDGWPGQASLYLLHIPKVGGCSLLKDLVGFMDRREIYSQERAYGDLHNPRGKLGKIVTMLREPRGQVLSLYYECKLAPEYRLFISRNVLKLLPETVDDWVHRWAEPWVSGKGASEWTFHGDQYGCYNPINMQSIRVMTNSTWQTKSEFDIRWQYSHIDPDATIRNMQAIDYLGILEAYQESVCLFHAKLKGALPPYCNCEDEKAWGSFDSSRFEHHTNHSGVESLSAETLKDIDDITSADRVLYAAGVKRFVQDVRDLEKQYGTKILCSEARLVKWL